MFHFGRQDAGHGVSRGSVLEGFSKDGIKGGIVELGGAIVSNFAALSVKRLVDRLGGSPAGCLVMLLVPRTNELFELPGQLNQLDKQVIVPV